MNHEHLLDANALPNLDYNETLTHEQAQSIAAMITEALTSGGVTAASGVAGYLYDRKNYLTVDRVGAERSPYGAPSDDIYLQIAVRIPQYALTTEAEKLLNGLETAAEEAAVKEAEERLEALRKQRETAEAAEQAAIERLKKLRKN